MYKASFHHRAEDLTVKAMIAGAKIVKAPDKAGYYSTMTDRTDILVDGGTPWKPCPTELGGCPHTLYNWDLRREQEEAYSGSQEEKNRTSDLRRAEAKGIDVWTVAEFWSVVRRDDELSVAGKLICFTKKLTMKHADAIKEATAEGAKVMGSLTRKTDILVAGPGTGVEIANAKAKGVDVWTEAEFMSVVEDPRPEMACEGPRKRTTYAEVKAAEVKAAKKRKATEEPAAAAPKAAAAKGAKKGKAAAAPALALAAAPSTKKSSGGSGRKKKGGRK